MAEAGFGTKDVVYVQGAAVGIRKYGGVQDAHCDFHRPVAAEQRIDEVPLSTESHGYLLLRCDAFPDIFPEMQISEFRENPCP